MLRKFLSQSEIKNKISETMALFQVKQLYVFTCAVGVSHQYFRFPKKQRMRKSDLVNGREPRKKKKTYKGIETGILPIRNSREDLTHTRVCT